MIIDGQKTDLNPEVLARMGIPDELWRAKADRIQERVRPIIQRYVSDLSKNIADSVGFLFWGDNGTGKTGTAVCIAKEARTLGATVYFTTVASMFRAEYEKEMFDGAEGITVSDRVLSVDLLILDEMGKEPSGESGFQERYLENLLRKRTGARNRATIATSNLTMEKLRAFYSHSMLEALKGKMLPVKFIGENQRDQNDESLRGRLLGMKRTG